MLLQLFITTVKEYKRFAEQLPIKITSDKIDSYRESIYIAVQTRLILLRKYMTAKENIYIGNVINEAIKNFQSKKDFLEKLRTQLIKIDSQPIEQILSDGTKINLSQSVKDVMYGLYLHADIDKIQRLLQTNNTLKFICTRKYVEDVETLVFELYDFLTQSGIEEMKNALLKAPVIHIGNSDDNLLQNIKGSPYWSNIYGKDLIDEDAMNLYKNCTEEEKLILNKTYLFLEELSEEYPSLDNLKSMVFFSTLGQWGNFSTVISFLRNMPNFGTSLLVTFNKERDVAYVKVFPHVEEGFIVSSEHIITGVSYITFFKYNISADWKIYAFGAPIDPLKRVLNPLESI